MRLSIAGNRFIGTTAARPTLRSSALSPTTVVCSMRNSEMANNVNAPVVGRSQHGARPR